jgi:hypothetical protein
MPPLIPRLPGRRPPTEEQLRAMLSAREPAGVSRYLMQARSNVAYVAGTGVIDLRQFGLGFGRQLVSSVVMPDHGIYVTLDEYLIQSNKTKLGIVATSREIADFLLGQHPMRDMLIALAQLNRIRLIPEQLDQLRLAYAQCIPEDAASVLNSLIANEAEPHFFLARQPILLAAREVILKAGTGAQTRDTSPLMTAVMLTHALANEIGPLDESGPQIWPGMPASALMEMVANASFNTDDWWVSRLDRLWRVWIEHGSLVSPPLARAPFEELVEDAVGTNIATLALLGLALAVPAKQWRYPEPLLAPERFVSDAAEADLEAVLKYVAADVDELAGRLEEHAPPWGFLPFEESPVIKLGEGRLLILDCDFLMRRVTTGLYWEVGKAERARGGEEAWRDWSKAHGMAVEAATEEQMRSLASRLPVLGSSEPQKTYFTEEDLRRAYPGPKKGITHKQCDGAIWLADSWIAFEIVTAEVKVQARQGLDLDAFRDDVENKVMKKLRQLDRTVQNLLLDGGAALMGFAMPNTHVQPILVQGGHFPLHPVIAAFIDDQMKKEGLFQDARVRKPLILHIDEIETLEAVAERHGDILGLLGEWQASSRRAGPFKNFLIAEGRVDHPSRLSIERARVWFAKLRDRVKAVA